ncbi:hypothetical protein [Zavarzinella formosa]|uniref:hypothetical protein n=1 Tax=Zavarzinella formosa TaxID=360055 RepID=UPI0002EEC043|nr:hypothetical protein [Zavarzinella formosa]
MYNWQLATDTTTYEGVSRTLNDALDRMTKYANGKTERDFHVNGHHMNEEFGLWISGGKVIHDNGEEFVPMNEWYARLGGGEPSMDGADVLAEATGVIVKAFRPQPTRGLVPTNPATFAGRDGGQA